MLTVPFYLGEDKRLIFEVTARDGRPFSILSASWTLQDDSGNLISSGAGQIDDMNGTIAVQIKPSQKGRMILEIQYVIGLETLIERVELSIC